MFYIIYFFLEKITMLCIIKYPYLLTADIVAKRWQNILLLTSNFRRIIQSYITSIFINYYLRLT